MSFISYNTRCSLTHIPNIMKILSKTIEQTEKYKHTISLLAYN